MIVAVHIDLETGLRNPFDNARDRGMQLKNVAV